MGGPPSQGRPSSRTGGRDPGFQKLHDLMPFRVREILLVSSAYDAFLLEEDGRLDERLFTAYSGLSLSWAPRMTHVTTAERGIQLLAERSIDLVITVVRLEDADATALSHRVKEHDPDLPVVLLTFDEADLDHFPGRVVPDTIDRVFLWTGDARILIAAIKLVEDLRNAEHDARAAGIQVILVVEDSVRLYSTFLAMLYAELMEHSSSLFAEGLNDLQRWMRMRARPKIVLVSTFEDALAMVGRFKDHLLALITDVRFPRGGRMDHEAGFELARLIRERSADLPIFVQSAEPGVEARAEALGAWHAHKHSPALLGKIRSFLKDALGFGDFVFRKPDRVEVGRARDLYEMGQLLATVPLESLEFHASRNHFSTWFNARGIFSLANKVKPVTIADFKDLEALRAYLVRVTEEELSHEQEGILADFSPRQGGPVRLLVRLGKGSVGGKGRGIAFVNSMLVRHGLKERFPGLRIGIPKTLVLGVEEFDRFLETAAIARDQVADEPRERVLRRFLDAKLDEELLGDLRAAFAELDGPLAVRSSSLLEDSRFQPFAGIYATYMLPNNHPDEEVRFRELCQAIRAVYASTFSPNARSYLAATPHSIGEEKMAVVIQEVVGRQHGDRYYPHISGVAQSYNYYPVGSQRAEDGVALVALGLGHAVVSGRASLRFSPASPAVLPQFASARDLVKSSQSSFHALDLSRSTVDFMAPCESSLVSCTLEEAERDGTFAAVGSVYCAEDDAIRDTLGTAGPRVVTFNNVLKWGTAPLAPALAQLLGVFRRAMGGDVEIEFAVDLASPARLYVLQVRPMATPAMYAELADAPDAPRGLLLCSTKRALGHGRIDHVRDVVYVKRGALDAIKTPAVAVQVGKINALLLADKAPYLLVGPGRWGSADPGLGIPVEWSQISGARAIVETSFEARPVEPSQGTHFLQNITFLRIGYLTVDGPTSRPSPDTGDVDWIDLDWLDAQTAVHELASVRHVRLTTALDIRLDGRRGTARIARGG